MSGTEIMDSVLKVAEKVASVDLEQTGKKVIESVRNFDAAAMIRPINPNNAERVERRAMATLDVAYLLANINGWFTEKQEECFERIAAQLGKRPSDLSANAVGLNAKLAHMRNHFSEEDFLKTFITECQPYCETFGGMLAPSRRAFALWITLGLADGEMTPMYRNALELLRKEFKHSSLLFGAIDALPVYGAATVAAGVSLGLIAAIAGGVKSLKHKQVVDKYVPLISKEFMEQAEDIVSKAMLLEQRLAETPDAEIQRKYDLLLQQLEELIDPPFDENEENE